MEIRSYEESITVELVRATENPAQMIKVAADLTQTKNLLFRKKASKGLLTYLVSAEHTSLFEHVTMTFAIQSISRALLAQVTRHRMSSFTSASQHYADYRDMPMSVHEDCVDELAVRGALNHSLESYKTLVDGGVPPEEARMVLPNASTVNLLWTINARSLINFMRQRLCQRNTEEMQVFANKIDALLCEYWLDLYNLLGPPCYMDGKCNQGKMTCGEPWIKP